MGWLNATKGFAWELQRSFGLGSGRSGGSQCVWQPAPLSRTRRTRSRRPPRCPGRAFPRPPIPHPDPIPISTIPTWHSILFYYYRLPGEGCSRRGPAHRTLPAPWRRPSPPGGPTATTVAPPAAVAVRSDSADPVGLPAPVPPSPARPRRRPLVSARGRGRACRRSGCVGCCYYCWPRPRSPHSRCAPGRPVPADPVCPDCRPVSSLRLLLPGPDHRRSPTGRSCARSAGRRRWCRSAACPALERVAVPGPARSCPVPGPGRGCRGHDSNPAVYCYCYYYCDDMMHLEAKTNGSLANQLNIRLRSKMAAGSSSKSCVGLNAITREVKGCHAHAKHEVGNIFKCFYFSEVLFFFEDGFVE